MEVFSRLTGEAERFFEEVGIHMSGSALKNHYRDDSDGDAEAYLAYLERSSGL